MTHRRAAVGLLGCFAILALAWPAVSRADHVIFGFDGNDRIRGGGGHDCLIGGKGADVLEGGAGADGGRGDDELVGGSGANSYDAGPGADRINARGRRELVRCGSGRDRARVDRRDKVRDCERLSFR